MNTENKLLKLRKLADAMYYAANYLTTDASRMHKAMEEYYQFIINEYHKEEPVSEEWVEELRAKLDSLSKEDFKKVFDKYAVDFNEEPVSEIDFEQELYKYFGQVKDFTLGMRIAKRFYEIGRNHQEPISEDLEEAASRYAKEEYSRKNPATLPDRCIGCYAPIMYAYKAGANWKEQQLLAKAFDFTKEHNIACVLASECLRNHGWFSRERDFNDLFRHLSCVDKLFEGKFSGKTKVIVIKED